MNPLSHVTVYALTGLLASMLSPPALAQTDVFRIDDMDLRDPHVFVNLLGCRDVTDTALVGFSVNDRLQASIQTDADMPPDGLLDLSTLIEFLPLDQSLNTNLMDSGSADCTAPIATTTCVGPIVPSGIAGDAALLSAGLCLAPIAGTVRPYTTEITNSAAPCFGSPIGTLTLDLGGIPVTLNDAQIAAGFVDTPASALVNGLIKGFVTEADADAALLPGTLPLIGGQPLSSVLPGGDPPGPNNTNCAAHSDVDIRNGVRGWWFYLNFTAMRVSVIDPFAAGFGDGFE
jgi:hypothetical protein